MPTYLMLSTLTPQGVQTLKANPSRLREVNRDVEELGAKVLHQWATLGEYDFVNIVEAPDAATVAICCATAPLQKSWFFTSLRPISAMISHRVA